MGKINPRLDRRIVQMVVKEEPKKTFFAELQGHGTSVSDHTISHFLSNRSKLKLFGKAHHIYVHRWKISFQREEAAFLHLESVQATMKSKHNQGILE